ncbi:MAG: serine--tRNA ligase, partial [Ilumatobacteraceae bacterium]
MIDVRLLRIDPDGVRVSLARRHKPELLEQLDVAIALDVQARQISTRRDDIRAKVNELSKAVGLAKRSGDEAAAEAAQAESRELGAEEHALGAQADDVQNELREVLLRIPNLPHPDAPDGQGDHENPLVKGPIQMPESFADHRRVPHWETAAELGILDSERATKIAASMFTMQRGAGASLARALCQLALDRNADVFEEVRPPTM